MALAPGTQKRKRKAAVARAKVPKLLKKGARYPHVFRQLGADFVRHFRREGYAVLRNALNAEQRKSFVRGFWKAMRHIRPDIKPEKRSTWQFPNGYKGIQCAYGLGQSDCAWVPRQSARIQNAFAALYKLPTKDLVVSLDAIILSDSVPKAPVPWFHKDQATSEKGLSVQGIYSAGRVRPTDAGTLLIPRSHKRAYGWESTSKDANGTTRQHLVVPEDEQGDTLAQSIKPYVPENGFLLFDSKLVHGNCPATEPRNETSSSGQPLPNRLAVAVAFAPRSRRSEETRQRKIQAYFGARTSNHWPCDRFSLKQPRPWNFVKGGKTLPQPVQDPKRIRLL